MGGVPLPGRRDAELIRDQPLQRDVDTEPTDLPPEGVSGGRVCGSDVFPSSFFDGGLRVPRGVCGVLEALLSSSESERVMHGLETEGEAEGEGDAGELRAAGGSEV